jgi:hypothetical protein
MLSRPEITTERVGEINKVLTDNPGISRTKLSKRICELWDWRRPDGQLKDISCRDMLRALDKSGAITLPKPRQILRVNEARTVPPIEHDTTPITGILAMLRPVEIVTVEQGDRSREFASLLDQYHYLGFDRTVGENMKYMAIGNDGAVLACLLFGSAAWSCRDRDRHIGWDVERRRENLRFMTNNTRFLIPPWVAVPHLASHVLSLCARRVSADWKKKYGHGVHCLETFVETGRFRGTCYKAANWILVGRTSGRGRNDINNARALPEKDIYLYPLDKSYRQTLTSTMKER